MTVDHAAKVIFELGAGAKMAKIDIAHTFRKYQSTLRTSLFWECSGMASYL